MKIVNVNIGDRFLLNDDETIVGVTIIDENCIGVMCIKKPITINPITSQGMWIYNRHDGKLSGISNYDVCYDIKGKLPTLKEKLEMI